MMQYDPKSPWADKRVRLAANYAFNRQAITRQRRLGYSVLSGSIVPRKFEYALPLESYAYDPKKAKQLAHRGRVSEWLRCRGVSVR